MIRFNKLFGFPLILSLTLLSTTSHAQYSYPLPFDYDKYPPIHHAVPFHGQQTQVWCWVAAAKMVAEFYARQPVPDQCAMLEIQYGAPCCRRPDLCARGGHISEIQSLIEQFGGRASTFSRPANGFALYDALRRGPIVMHTRQGAGHFVVAVGIRLVPSPIGPLAMVSISDPFYGRYEVDFPSLMQAWTAALIIH